ncbi:SAV_2336 N-terminal domain-related protein [Streptomyces phaeochromogenes]|uniref:SAV_2336 N-terminal domain-related protein n=1 Tax=Streptomyces phaeochromogenes TaxID=1923 RepID=UPI00386FAF7F|nr:SAV_2336 family protein [Streptomyces phaeochromogenes]
MPASTERDDHLRLSDLVARLQTAGLTLDARSLADALWLASYVSPRAAATDSGDGDAVADSNRAPLPPLPEGISPPSEPPPAPDAPQADGMVELLPVRTGAIPHRDPLGTVVVPSASAFPALLPLQRALRPFQRYRPSVVPAHTEVDEEATADRAADCGLVWPVLRRVRGREADLQLLVDASASMAVWEQMLYELHEVFEWVGAFRNVTVHYLSLHGTRVGMSLRPGASDPHFSADRLLGPNGQRVTLIISDCAGPLWHGHAMQQLMHRGITRAPLAVLQPLSQRLWAHTHLPAIQGTLHRRAGRYSPLGFVPQLRATGDAPPPEALPVPVLSASPGALSTWARLVAGATGVRLRGSAAWVGANTTSDTASSPPRVPEPRGVDAERLLATFEASASPLARQLVAYLSAAPLVLPVMQLVQRAMLPQTGPSELSEVLLSGLVFQAIPQQSTDGAWASHDDPWYDFVPGVRDLLIARLSASEAALVLKHCSLYIERAFGRSARNFPAVAVAYLMDIDGAPETGSNAVPEPFARVSERVIARFEPEPVRLRSAPTTLSLSDLGQARLSRYEEDGSQRDLLSALRLLRVAGTTEASGELLARLADALRHAWQEWGGDALDEAEQAARSAIEAEGDLPTRLALARVLDTRARAAIAAGRATEALPSLQEAISHCRAALTQQDTASAEASLECVLQLVNCLRTLSTLTATVPHLAPLAEAEEACTTHMRLFSAGHVPPALLLSRGTVLLGQARLSGEQGFAVRATADLSAAAHALRSEQTRRPGQLLLALTALAEALTLEPAGQGSDEAHRLLVEAAQLARDSNAPLAEAECLSLIARNRQGHYDHTGDADDLQAADSALSQARRLVPPDTPTYVELLTAAGELVLKRAELQPTSAALAARAVQLLREANGQAATYDAGTARRRLLFGHALRLRHERQGRLADLHEAAWTLELAAREGGEVSARAWLELGDVQSLLAQRTDVFGHYAQASAAYGHAASRTGDSLVAARAHHRRGEVYEHTAGQARALESYRLARTSWEEAEAAGTEEALRTMDRIRCLESPP